MNILEKIRSDVVLQEKVEAVCGIFIFSNNEKRSPDDTLKFNIESETFATSGAAEDFDILPDGSIGYGEYEYDHVCGRIAESMKEFLEFMLNCKANFAIINYGRKELADDPTLLAQEITKREPEGKAMFLDYFNYGCDDLDDNIPEDEFKSLVEAKYEALKKEVAEALGLTISNDISKDILPKYYRTALREPFYYWESSDFSYTWNGEVLNKSRDLIQK